MLYVFALLIAKVERLLLDALTKHGDHDLLWADYVGVLELLLELES